MSLLKSEVLLLVILLSRSEVWHFYEEWFGKVSEMPHSDYKLITAANMRPKRSGKCKKLKITPAEKLGE